MNSISRYLRSLLRKRRLDADMAEEMSAHLEQRAEANIAAGMSPDEARHAAQRQFGGVEQLKEVAREQRGGRWLEQTAGDFRFAIRSLLKTPGFTASALLTLALGVGMNTAMFSVLNGFMLRPLSFPQSERLFRLREARPQDGMADFSAANFDEIARPGAAVAELAALRFGAFTLTEPNRPADVPIALRVSANYFDVLGKPPELGRGFRADEATAGNDRVIVVSHRYWRTHFRGDPGIVGRSVQLDGASVEIIGVLPAADDTLRFLAPVGIYRPLVWNEGERANRSDRGTGVIGRYRDGVTPKRADAVFQTAARRLATDHPAENTGLDLVAQPLQATTLRGAGRTTTYLLVGLSGFVLLIACGNLANLLLARALSRSWEFSLRGALGASRLQVMRPLLAESVLLAGGGALAAVPVSVWTSAWLARHFGTAEYPVDFSMDGRVLFFAATASVLAALLFGVAPAWWAARIDPATALKRGGRGSGGGHRRYRQVLIAAQFALALVLLAGAGFFFRGLSELTSGRLGWEPAPMISGTLNLASGNYASAESIIAFHAASRERLLALPGVANAAVSFEVPLFDSPAQRNYRVEGRQPPPPGRDLTAFTNGVSAGYFDTVGTRLLRGRLIDGTDQLKSRPVAVINESMARALFPEGDALGSRLGLAGRDDPGWAEIVGIVEDTRTMNVAPSPIRFQVYKPFTQEAWQYVTIAVRATDSAKAPALLEPIRKIVASLDADQPILRLMTAPERIAEAMNVWRTINRLLMLFAGLGLLLAALGIYGVIARLVAQRTGEIGVRLALGAGVADILRLVVGSGLRMAAVGAVVGVIGAIFFARFLAEAMPAFGRFDAVPIIVAGAMLMVVALAACVLPARRAARVDPLAALRCE